MHLHRTAHRHALSRRLPILGAMPLSEPPRPHRSSGCTARVFHMYNVEQVDTTYVLLRSSLPSGKTYGAERGSRYQTRGALTVSRDIPLASPHARVLRFEDALHMDARWGHCAHVSHAPLHYRPGIVTSHTRYPARPSQHLAGQSPLNTLVLLLAGAVRVSVGGWC